MVCLESTELSDTGRRRQDNDDACLRLPDQGIFCIADGMGGVVGGDLASEAITTALQEVFTKDAPTDQAHLPGRIALFQKGVNQASQWIKRFADEKGIRQMGSTVVALLFDPRNPDCAVGLHAGDSRLYRYRLGVLKLLTSDHTAMALLSGKLGCTPASLPANFQNGLVRAVGLSETVDLEQTLVAVRSGDLFLLCSDGLTRMLPDAAIAAILGEHAREVLDVSAKALVQAANAAGGRDNITIILVRAGEPEGLPEATQAEEETTVAASDSLATKRSSDVSEQSGN
jgi:protein phosphatase